MRRWFSRTTILMMAVFPAYSGATLPVTNGLILHLDADSITGVNHGGTINVWQDISGNGNDAYSHGDPQYITEAINGLPTIRFDGAGDYFNFSEQDDIRTVFWVLKEHPSAGMEDYRPLLGHHSSYHFHRGGSSCFWDETWAEAYVRNGITRLNGSVVDGTTTEVPTDYSIVSIITNGNVTADQLSQDRIYPYRSWYGDMAEVVIYNRVLNTAEHYNVGGYLATKYGLESEYDNPVLLHQGDDYTAWLDDMVLEIMTVAEGDILTRWPIGTTVTRANPYEALAATATLPEINPVISIVNGFPTATWHWILSEGPIAEQIETLTFFPHYIQQQVKVKWRETKPTFWRVNYGGRLAGGCFDLEGLWRYNRSNPARWLPTPVPGIYTDTGTTTYERTIKPHVSEDLTLVLGGVDDEDETFWNAVKIGETPLDYGAMSWAQIRRYVIDSKYINVGASHIIRVIASNSDGPGGIWRGPCVLGPQSVLMQTPSEDGWVRATAVGNALYNWCPDNYEWPLIDRFTVSLTSQDRTEQTGTRRFVPENITTGGRFVVPPYLVAIDGLHGYWGIGTLTLPRAEDGLRVEWRDGTLTCPFLLKTGDPEEIGLWTQAPPLGLFVGTSPHLILERYLDVVDDGSEPEYFPDWWSGPEYCTWGDQCYISALTGLSPGELMTDTNVRNWLQQIATLGLTFKQITLDAGWWQLSPSIIDEIHAANQHAVLWTQPHWGPTSSTPSTWGVKDALGTPILYDDNNYILDYSQSTVRQYIEQQFAAYFNPSGWNADGIKLDFGYVGTPLWAACANEAWGAGEQYRARVAQHVYQVVKNCKSDALVTWGSMNPLFGEVNDFCPVNEDWWGDPERLRNRAHAIHAGGGWAMSTDWSAYEHYLPELLVEEGVWGCPTIQSVYYRGDAANNPIPLTSAWAKRLKAITFLSSLSPVNPQEKILYDPQGYIKRLSAEGNLVSAARPINGSLGPAKVMIVSKQGRFYVASTVDGQVDIPGTIKPYKVYSIQHDGSRQEYALWEETPSSTRLTVNDSADNVWFYELVTCDFNGDNYLDIKDLNAVARDWLSLSPIDVNGDNVINYFDFAIFARQYEESN